VNHVYLVNIMTHVVVAWELSYCFLIWRPAWRWWMLILAIPLHLGIAICMGMITFGLIMLVGNMAFVEPSETRALLARGWLMRAGQGGPRRPVGQEAPVRNGVAEGEGTERSESPVRVPAGRLIRAVRADSGGAATEARNDSRRPSTPRR
jgi:hypothetical protein